MLGFSFSLTAWGSELVWTVVCGRRGRKGKEGKGKERKGKEGKGRERKGQEGKGRERMGREGKGRERKGKEGKGRERKGKEWVGKEAAGDQRVWLRGRLRTAWVQGWLEMVGEKKPLVMSELGCADGCGREMGAENCANVCGRRGCNGVAGNGWGEEAAGNERAWLRGRLRTATGLRGRLRTAWVPGSGWKWVGRRSRWWWASLAARTAADGKWVRRIARTARCKGVAGNGWAK